MKIIISGPKDNPRTLIRRAGYGEHYDNRSGQISYVRRLDRNIFPKFHVYLDERQDGVEISLHIDQKQPSYGAGHMHSGDYEGPRVEQELERIKQVFENASANTSPQPSPNIGEGDNQPKKRGFFSKLFG
jgi:hypothetical protein